MPALTLELRKRVGGSFNAADDASLIYVKSHISQVDGLLSGGKIVESLMPSSVFDGLRFVGTINGAADDTTAELVAQMATYISTNGGSYRGLFLIATSINTTVTVSTGHSIRTPENNESPVTSGGSVVFNPGDWLIQIGGDSSQGEFAQITNEHALATALKDGLLSAADYTKLQNLVSNATHTGDVTGSGALTISAGAVSLPKMAQLPANTIIGNDAGAAATPQALTQAEVRAFLGLGTAAYEAVGTFNRTTSPLLGVSVFDDIVISKGLITSVRTKSLTLSNFTVTDARMIGRNAGSGGGATEMTSDDVRTFLNVANGATANAKAVSADVITGTDDTKFLTVARGAQQKDYLSGLKAYGTVAADLATANAAHPDGAIVLFVSA